MSTLWTAVITAAALLLPVTASAAATPGTPASGKRTDEYTITVIPYYSPEKLWARFAPFVDHLKKETGLPWELKLYHNHETLLDGLCSGEVSLALLGPVPLGRALQRCGADIVAVPVGKDGRPVYHAVIITSDPAVTTLAGLRQKRFALFKGSTAAHIVPLKMLREAGLTERDIVPVFSESQDHIINALLSRDVAAAGVKEALYRRFQGDPLRVLKTSDPLPNFAFAAAPGLSERTRKRFADALLKLRPQADPKDRELARDWDDEIKNGFILPPADFRAAVLNMLSVYEEIMHADK